MLLNQVATALAYGSSACILLPAGRDIFSYSTNLLPGEDKTRPLMTMRSASARTFTWGLWGLNHCAFALLKLMAIRDGDKSMLKFLTALTALTTCYCILGQQQMEKDGGDVKGFAAVCAVQTVSLGYLAA